MRSRISPRWRTLLVGLALAGLAALFTAPAALAAPRSPTGTIDGNLVDGTAGGTPIPGQTITLMLQSGPDARQVATTVTDGQGLFHFSGLATDPADVYVATVQFQGAPYATDPLNLADNPSARVTLLAYEATSSDAKIGVAQVVIELRKPDVPAGLIGVAELVTVVNGDQRTYVGTPGPADGKPPDLLRFGLPAGASDLQTSDGFEHGQVLQVDRGFATTAPVLPGATRFAFTYSYPYAGTRSLFTYQAIYPTLRVILLAPPDVTITAPGLAAQGTVKATGQTVQVWQGSNFPAGTTVEVAVTKLPVPGQPSDLNLALLYWLAGILAALAFGLVGYHLARARREAANAATNGAPAAAGTGMGEAAPPQAPDQSTADLLLALAKLDRAREAGKLDEQRYRMRRTALKDTLKARMLAGASSPAATGGER